LLSSTSVYFYRMCPYQNITQRDSGSLHVVMGVWKQWIVDESAGTYAMLYTDGSTCGNGASRETRVMLTCPADLPLGTDGSEDDRNNETPRVGDVVETARCVYTMQFITPMACQLRRSAASPDARDGVAEVSSQGAEVVQTEQGPSSHVSRMQACIRLLWPSSSGAAAAAGAATSPVATAVDPAAAPPVQAHAATTPAADDASTHSVRAPQISLAECAAFL